MLKRPGFRSEVMTQRALRPAPDGRSLRPPQERDSPGPRTTGLCSTRTPPIVTSSTAAVDSQTRLEWVISAL